MFSQSVDVLFADLAAVTVDEDLLSVAELGRALGIASPPHLRQYLAAHTWLRQRLAEYLDVPPAEIAFGANDCGKPEVASPSTDLAFNLSYSNGMAALAVGFRKSVGVDVETLEGAQINPEMIYRVLSPSESNSVLLADDRVRAFLRLWVRKEALAKATGHHAEADEVNVMGISPLEIDGFEVTDINIGEGFVAAVAVPPGTRIELMTLLEAAV